MRYGCFKKLKEKHQTRKIAESPSGNEFFSQIQGDFTQPTITGTSGVTEISLFVDGITINPKSIQK